MDKIKVIIENKQDEVKIPTGIRMLVRRCCVATLKMEGFTGMAEVNVIFVDGHTIRDINKKQRNIDEETDVLSFPLGENGEYDINPESDAKMLGDIVISIPRALQQSDEYEHTFQREIGYLTVHSMLHILGYDHVEGGLEAVKMREKEELVMNRIGLPRSASYVME